MNITISGEFPTLNEIIKVSKSHHMKYANQKRTFTSVTFYSVAQMPKIDFKAHYNFTWYRKHKRNNPDNITVGQKYIFDGLVEAGKLPNDGWNEIASISHKFAVDKQNPRVEIEITEVE